MVKKTRIKPISDKRKAEMEGEYEIREQLCERAGGYWVRSGHQYRCIGGLCELCGQPPDWIGLEMHEKIFRSAGGKVSLDNSIMLCDTCHKRKHGIVVKEG